MTAVVAHRGAHLQHRENTLEAFRAALALGVDGVELDVRRTLDGVLVVHHDPAIGGRLVGATLARDLPEYVPVLAVAMDALRGVTVNVEIKNSPDPGEGPYDPTGALARQVLDLVGGLRADPAVMVSCFDLATCERARDYDADVRVAWLVSRTPLVGALAEAHRRGFAAVNPHLKLVQTEAVERSRELGLDLNVWTVNRSRDLEAMAAFEVASVITDQPARALALYGRGSA